MGEKGTLRHYGSPVRCLDPIHFLTLPTKVRSDSLGRIGSLKRTSDKSLFPIALGSCDHRITHQLRPLNMNGRSILSVTSIITLEARSDDVRSLKADAGWRRESSSSSRYGPASLRGLILSPAMHQGQAVPSGRIVALRIVPDDQAVTLDLLGDLLPKGVRDQSVHSVRVRTHQGRPFSISVVWVSPLASRVGANGAKSGDSNSDR